MKAPTRALRVSHNGRSAEIVSPNNIGTARVVVSMIKRLLGRLKVVDEGARRVDREKYKVKDAFIVRFKE